MKQDSKIILILLTIALFSSGLYFVIKSQQQPNQIDNAFVDQLPAPSGAEELDEGHAPGGEAAADPSLTAQPSLSDGTDLGTIEQELDQTNILEEDFSNL